MGEKFMKLSASIRWIITALTWLITAAGFLGSVILKHYHSIYIVEVILTCVGLFFCILAICLTILMLTHKDNEKEETKNSVIAN